MDIDQLLQYINQYQTLIAGILPVIFSIIRGSSLAYQRQHTKVYRERWLSILCRKYIEFERELFSGMNVAINLISFVSSSIIYPLLSLPIINMLSRLVQMIKFEALTPLITIPTGFFLVPLIICIIMCALIERKTFKSKDLDALKSALSSSQKYYSHMLGIMVWLILVFVLLSAPIVWSLIVIKPNDTPSYVLTLMLTFLMLLISWITVQEARWTLDNLKFKLMTEFAKTLPLVKVYTSLNTFLGKVLEVKRNFIQLKCGSSRIVIPWDEIKAVEIQEQTQLSS